ncbi:hypothetical protein [Streptomyces antnestii]|nr:hypothetical protein [Streptomyces sp. San01]
MVRARCQHPKKVLTARAGRGAEALCHMALNRRAARTKSGVAARTIS